MTDLRDPIYHNDEAARLHLEAQRWPDGPYCPRCGECEKVTRLQGKSTAPGLCFCNSCRTKFSVTMGTVFERSHIPLSKWMLGFRLMASSKKGISALQLQRSLDLKSYKSAWFMAHRIREAMAIPYDAGEPMGGEGKKAHREISALEVTKDAAYAIAADIKRLAGRRHDVIHGVALDRRSDGTVTFSRFHFDGLRGEARKTTYQASDLSELIAETAQLEGRLDEHFRLMGTLLGPDQFDDLRG